MTLTAVVVDDHSGFRAMARLLLEDAGFEVVGEAADGAGAIATVTTLQPRLLLLDVQLPDTDGFAVAEELARTAPRTVVVLTSVRCADDYGRTRLASTSARQLIAKADLSGTELAALVATAP